MHILRESNYTCVPWKNRGGVTREILRSPAEGAGFDWRLSLATIDLPGPFSTFAGYHRTLVLVAGAGVELSFGQHGTCRLSVPGQSVEFDGAWPTSCSLLDGPSTDLNLMDASGRALISGRNHATIDDVRALAHPVLRHRILVGYRAEAEGVSVEQVIDRLLEAVPSPIGS